MIELRHWSQYIEWKKEKKKFLSHLLIKCVSLLEFDNDTIL